MPSVDTATKGCLAGAHCAPFATRVVATVGSSPWLLGAALTPSGAGELHRSHRPNFKHRSSNHRSIESCRMKHLFGMSVRWACAWVRKDCGAFTLSAWRNGVPLPDTAEPTIAEPLQCVWQEAGSNPAALITFPVPVPADVTQGHRSTRGHLSSHWLRSCGGDHFMTADEMQIVIDWLKQREATFATVNMIAQFTTNKHPLFIQGMQHAFQLLLGEAQVEKKYPTPRVLPAILLTTPSNL